MEYIINNKNKFDLFVQYIFPILPILILISHLLRVYFLPYGFSISKFNVYQKREIDLDLPYDQAFNLVIEAIRADIKSKIEKTDVNNGKIIATRYEDAVIRESIIVAELCRKPTDRLHVMIWLSPIHQFCILDFGANLIAIENITNHLNEHSTHRLDSSAITPQQA